MNDSTYWTIAYRKPKANRFQRATDLATDWQTASDIARRVGIAHPDLEVWTTTTAEAERNGFGSAEDNANILTDSGKRVRVIDNGSLASLLPAPATRTVVEVEPCNGRRGCVIKYSDGSKTSVTGKCYGLMELRAQEAKVDATVAAVLPRGTAARQAIAERVAIDIAANAPAGRQTSTHMRFDCRYCQDVGTNCGREHTFDTRTDWVRSVASLGLTPAQQARVGALSDLHNDLI